MRMKKTASQMALQSGFCKLKFGVPSGIRTLDTLIKSQRFFPVYQLLIASGAVWVQLLKTEYFLFMTSPFSNYQLRIFPINLVFSIVHYKFNQFHILA